MLCGFPFIIKGSDSSDRLAGIVQQDPAGRLPVTEKDIFPGIENVFDFSLKRTNPRGVAAVETDGCPVKSGPGRFIVYFGQLHWIGLDKQFNQITGYLNVPT
jgi:hypothetical protein